jgi:hypothetical protein
MTMIKKTVTTVETTVPGDRPGVWVTRTTRTETIEETLQGDERPSFGALARQEPIELLPL